jgi:hypothetical protein
VVKGLVDGETYAVSDFTSCSLSPCCTEISPDAARESVAPDFGH